MNKNLSTPLVVKVLDKREFELHHSFTFHLNWKDYQDITVPKKFITDFASIPKAFWSLIPPFGQHTKAAVLHDYIYVYHGMQTRKQADDIFLKAMEMLGVGKLKRKIMYRAVRMFAGGAWKKGN